MEKIQYTINSNMTWESSSTYKLLKKKSATLFSDALRAEDAKDSKALHEGIPEATSR